MPLTLINNIKMKMQSIELKQHLIDGVPAAKYGEWPGIKPSKWNGGIKIIRPLDQDIFFGIILIFLKNIFHYRL
jgi:hypothetical protein